MRAGIRISSLVPSGLVIESVSDSSDSIIIAVRAESGVAECPLCGARSSRIHSRYDRRAADLPCAGKEIRLRGARDAWDRAPQNTVRVVFEWRGKNYVYTTRQLSYAFTLTKASKSTEYGQWQLASKMAFPQIICAMSLS
jgi:hypothetical protein